MTGGQACGITAALQSPLIDFPARALCTIFSAKECFTLALHYLYVFVPQSAQSPSSQGHMPEQSSCGTGGFG
eukprot:8215627-Alexandrium_andersonii.AAC.1